MVFISQHKGTGDELAFEDQASVETYLLREKIDSIRKSPVLVSSNSNSNRQLS